MKPINPLQTYYGGIIFRSCLEARWAIFFDTAGIQWEYEREGFHLGSLGNYLPDFWLPQVNMWAEVKPIEFSIEEVSKCQKLMEITGYPVLMLDGMPGAINYWATDAREGFTDYEINSDQLRERRFYACTGVHYPTRIGCWTDAEGVHAARTARFDNGKLHSLEKSL